MSLSSILLNINKKGQRPHNYSQINSTKNANNDTFSTSLASKSPSSSSPREVDPVVARLKAARKAEKEKRELELRAKKGLGPKKDKQPTKTNQKRNDTKSTKAGSTSNLHSSQISQAPSISARRPPSKKMNFNDLMKKASQMDNSKLSIDLKSKTKSPEVTSKSKIPTKAVSSGQIKARIPNRAVALGQPRTNIKGPLKPAYPGHSRMKEYDEHNRNSGKPPIAKKFKDSSPNVASSRAPLPIRKPSSKLEEKLKNKPNAPKKGIYNQLRHSGSNQEEYYDDDNDDDLDSFIESDDEEESYGRHATPDYDRDEIWAMFNKGKKRSYYDQFDDSGDDMEATGAEIFEEEQRSKKRAIEEDRKELEEEQRLAALKKARKKR